MWGTLYKGAITWNVAMRYAALCFLLVLVGGLTGIPLAEAGLTLHFARTIYVPAHFHFIMGLFATYAIFASVYFWFPAMTGRTADNLVAKIAFWFNAVGHSAHLLAAVHHRRGRYAAALLGLFRGNSGRGACDRTGNGGTTSPLTAP